MDRSWWQDKVLPGVVGALILLVVLVVLNAISGGGFVHLMGGATKADIANIQAMPGPKGDSGAPGPKIPRSCVPASGWQGKPAV